MPKFSLPLEGCFAVTRIKLKNCDIFKKKEKRRVVIRNGDHTDLTYSNILDILYVSLYHNNNLSSV